MKTKSEFKGFVIPNDYLSKIQGGMNSGVAFVCPDCGESSRIATGPLRIFPPYYVCLRCYCTFQVFLNDGEITIINHGKAPEGWLKLMGIV